MSTGI